MIAKQNAAVATEEGMPTDVPKTAEGEVDHVATTEEVVEEVVAEAVEEKVPKEDVVSI